VIWRPAGPPGIVLAVMRAERERPQLCAARGGAILLHLTGECGASGNNISITEEFGRVISRLGVARTRQGSKGARPCFRLLLPACLPACLPVCQRERVCVREVLFPAGGTGR
jgi:hypothetical protein